MSEPIVTRSPIFFETAGETETPADLVAVFRTAADTKAVGQPGKQAGDLMLVERPEGGHKVVISLGASEKCTPEAVRRAGGSLGRWLLDSGVAHIDLDLDSLQNAGVDGAAGALLEGIRLGAYRFQRYKKSEEETRPVRVTLRGPGLERLQEQIEHATALTDAVLLARDLAHEPANVINPVTLAERARQVAGDLGLKVRLLDESELSQMGAGAILAVGRGSLTPPRIILIEYPGSGAEAGAQPVVVVGKAITFDTGGYSIKDTSGIVGMKYDKCGGIDVLALMQAAAVLKLKTPLVGVISAAENMISGAAYRPDDIITTLSGKTVEIVSTDAEGRLVLADALTYVQREYQPRAIIDLATLTGGVVVALGRVRAGMVSNNDDLARRLMEAGEKTHERIWRLPLDDDYVRNMKGEDADLKNSGGREGHPVLAGAFLSEFVDKSIPWAHLDIAGVADTPKDLPYAPKGATGFGIRLLVEYLEQLS